MVIFAIILETFATIEHSARTTLICDDFQYSRSIPSVDEFGHHQFMFIVIQKRGDIEFYMSGRNEFTPDFDKAQEFPTKHDAEWGIWTVPEAAWRRMCKVEPAPVYDPTNESLLAKVQAGEWVSRDELVLDKAIQGAERQELLADRAAYLRGDWASLYKDGKYIGGDR